LAEFATFFFGLGVRLRSLGISGLMALRFPGIYKVFRGAKVFRDLRFQGFKVFKECPWCSGI
jgi:hypothetical protein